ncbi:hypothetical protein KCU65_g1772, partial [Aureobasidium melanogenum]
MQGTAYTNSTTSKATQTSISSVSETTPGPSLTRSCGFWLPNEIFLNSWWTQHATFTVATEVDYYIQYNNTLVLANSTSRYGGITASYTATAGDSPGEVVTGVYTDLELLETMGVLASMQWEFPGVPSNLISLLPSTTNEFTYAETRLHTYSEITTEWGIEATRTKTVVASPTPYAEPMVGILDVKYLDESGDVVEATNYTDLQTLEYTGGIWLESDIDWPSKVYFDSIPVEFIEWVQRNASVASSFPWLNECTNYVGKRPTGAPTVHIVVSTLTHTTSSIIATRPGNLGGAVPVSSSERTTKTSAQATSEASTEIESSAARPQTTATTAAEQTSSDVERTSAIPSSQISATDASGTSVQQASPTSAERASPTSAEQATSTAAQQIPSTGAEQGQTTNIQHSTVPPSSAVDYTGLPSTAQVISTENNGGATPETSAVSDAAPRPSATTVAAGSEDGNQVSSATTIPINGQIVTSGGYTEPQQAGTTTSYEGPGPSTAPQGAATSEIHASQVVQTNKPAESSLPSETTVIAIAPILTLGSTMITPNPSSEYIINSQTLAPGGPAITIDRTTYSLAPSASAIIQNGVTQSLAPTISVSTVPQITLGSSVITANPTGGFIYASQTLSAGGSAIFANGNTHSLATSGASTYIVSNGITQQVTPSQTAAPVLTFGTSAVTANSESVFVVGEQTLEVGGSAIVVGETTYSLKTSGFSTLVVHNGVTSTLADGTTGIAPAITIGSKTITQNSANEYVIGDQTLAPGHSGIEVEGTTYSLATSASASFLVENGVTATLAAEGSPSIASSAEVHLTANALSPQVSVVTQNTASAYMVAGQTLKTGGSAIEVEGTTYSLLPSSAILINGVTSSLPIAPTSPAISLITNTVLPEITLPSTTMTPNAASEYVIGTQTLLPGNPSIEVQGTTYSLAPSATAVVVNGVTKSLSAFEATEVVIDGQTVSPNTEIEVQGTTYSLSPSGTAILVNGKLSSLPTTPAEETPLFVIGSTTLKPGEAVTEQGTTYSIPSIPTLTTSGSGTTSEPPVVVINGKLSTLPATKGTGAAVLSGLQRTSASALSGSRVTGSATTTTSSTQGLESAGRTQSVASTSTAGAERAVQRGTGDIVVALIFGVIGMVVF